MTNMKSREGRKAEGQLLVLGAKATCYDVLANFQTKNARKMLENVGERGAGGCKRIRGR